VLWVERNTNKRAQLILQLNKSTPPRLRKQRDCLNKKIHQWTRLVPSTVESIIDSTTE
jgi:hypothetical protein